MDLDLKRPLRHLTFLLMALAAMAMEIAAQDQRPVLQSLALASGWIGLGLLAYWVIPRPAHPSEKPNKWIVLFITLLFFSPFGIEPWRREYLGDGYPLELQMVCGLRNAGLGLAACAGWFHCLKLAAVASLFLALFSAAMTNHPVVMVMLGLYALAGGIWLALRHWGGLQSLFLQREKMIRGEVVAREGWPWLSLSLLAIPLLGALALAVFGPRHVPYALGEWLPTSGGSGETDLYARRGLGHGPEEVAGPNARAAGMVETDRMIEDNKEALVDAISDMYGPPHKPRNNPERMIPAGRMDVIQFHGRLPENRRPNRDFDTSRQGPNNPRRPESQKARGLFEVQGRTPLHIRRVVYEIYDVENNRWIEGRKPAARLLEAEENYWFRFLHFRPPRWYLQDLTHKFKTADYEDNLVPTPALGTHVRIKLVDRADYYDWDYDGVLTLAGRKRLPPGVVISTRCHTLDFDRLPPEAFASLGLGTGFSPAMLEVPSSLQAELQCLAYSWAGNQPWGWPQIHAILTQLREHYVLDWQASAPAEHPQPILWFLSESHRGPDYLFASAATLMFRSLGYPTRLCLGYYVSPDAYDPKTDHTPVRTTDLHFWPEVLLSDGQWLVVEPTPGYEVLGPVLPVWERLAGAVKAAVAWLSGHWWQVLIVSALLLAAVVWCRTLWDFLAVQTWLWFSGRSWRDWVLGAQSILEQRAKWSGYTRLPGQTCRAWLETALCQQPRQDADLIWYTQLLDWAAYGPPLPPPWPPADIQQVCQRVVRSWTLSCWRRLAIAGSNGREGP
jgi:hypothetical protein